MKRDDLIREIRKAAKANGLAFDLVRQVGPHDVFRLGRVTLAIPRHRELGPKMAFEIRAECETELGKRWWR